MGFGDVPYSGAVHVENGAIVGVGGSAPSPADGLDARGGTVILGLIDAHCHAYGFSLDFRELETGFGTDLMGDLEDDQLLEFSLRSEVEAVADTLRSATSVNADLIRRPDLGRVEEGETADLVVLAGDPFVDRSVLWSSERAVVQAGRVVRHLSDAG